MFGFGHWEILLVFVVILLVFGAKRIPEIGQGMGQGIRQFKKGLRGGDTEGDVGLSNAQTESPQRPTNH
ncbi:MAG: twin-arginine translocase TatA/TatE family subunit [Candidatus Latescibacteria bacterium]|nr:twin-arginine translocase TatA/TatE family subunit [Candidatus Latescibacterota bacterium]